MRLIDADILATAEARIHDTLLTLQLDAYWAYAVGYAHAMLVWLLKNAPTVEAVQQRWIPVSENLPPDQEEVLVLTLSRNGVRNADKGYWAIDHFIHRGRAQVTHWMPLPEPPEEGGD